MTKEERRKYKELQAYCHLQVGLAIKEGRLVRPLGCSECGREGDIEGHHEDYNKPLEVVWLCIQCHIKRRKPVEFGRDGRIRKSS
jgi:hypothetical protein